MRFHEINKLKLYRGKTLVSAKTGVEQTITQVLDEQTLYSRHLQHSHYKTDFEQEITEYGITITLFYDLFVRKSCHVLKSYMCNYVMLLLPLTRKKVKMKKLKK